MYCIVPLAGPDFWIDKLRKPKPLIEVDGVPLVENAIKSRPWYLKGSLKNEAIIFILRETPHTASFKDFLQERFHGSQTVVISYLTRGALLTALAGTSLISDYSVPVCVDLVDILYDAPELDIEKIFRDNPSCGGILPYFKSNYEKYSYLQIRDGQVQRTVEKKVISDNASAGTYWFRNLPRFLDSVSGSLSQPDLYSVNNALFLCPAFNELIKKKWEVSPFPVLLRRCVSRYIKEITE